MGLLDFFTGTKDVWMKLAEYSCGHDVPAVDGMPVLRECPFCDRGKFVRVIKKKIRDKSNDY